MKNHPNRVPQSNSIPSRKTQTKTGQGKAGQGNGPRPAPTQGTLTLSLNSNEQALLASAAKKRAADESAPVQPGHFAKTAILAESLRTLGQTADPLADLEQSVMQAVTLISLLSERLGQVMTQSSENTIHAKADIGLNGLADYTAQQLVDDFAEARNYVAGRLS